MLQLNKAFLTIKTMTKYFLTKMFLWKLCWSCSTIVTIQKNGFYCLKISLFSSAEGFQTIKAGTKYFLTKLFRGNFVEVVQQSLPSRKMSFIASKYHFLAQQSISDNKSRDKIFSDKIVFTEILLKLFNNWDQLKKINYTA